MAHTATIPSRLMWFQQALSSVSARHWIGVSLVLAYALGIAFKGTFAKLAYGEDTSVMAVLMWRFLLSMPLFWGIAAAVLKPSELPLARRDWPACIAAGVVFYAFVYCDYKGLSLIEVSVERIILFTYPIFVIALNMLISRIMPGRGQIGALIIVQLGIAILVLGKTQGAAHNLAGELWVFAAALCHAAYVLLIQRHCARIGSVKFSTYAMSVCFALLCMHFGLTEPLESLRINLDSFAYIAMMVVFSTVLPTYCFTQGIALIGGNRASIISVIGPFITVLAAHEVLHETLYVSQIAGGVVIIGGILWLELSQQKAKALKLAR